VFSFWTGILRGEVAMAAREWESAEAAFASAEPRLKMSFNIVSPEAAAFGNNVSLRDGVARARAARGDLAGAIAAYRALLTPGIGQKYTALLEPRFVLALARLLEKSGDRPGAAREYQRFLDLWRGADQDSPELAEARSALRRVS
jgi:hypothetical protein